MKRVPTLVGVTILSLLPAAGLIGCGDKMKESEKTQREATGLENAADMIARGEKNVADGEAMIARGKALQDQHDNVQGDRLVAEGKTMKSLGEEQIDQGRKLRAKNKDD